MNEQSRIAMARKNGIHIPAGYRWAPAEKRADGYFKIKSDAQMGARYAYDAAPLTAPNVGGPAQYFNVISPNITKILYSKLSATELLPLKKEGSFESDTVSMRVVEIVGGTSAYGDYTKSAVSDVNSTWPIRESYRYSTQIMYGELETARAGAALINLVAEKQEAAADILARTENMLYLWGMQGKNLHGILNDPNLNSPINALPVTNSQGANKTKWADKSKDAVHGVNHIAADVKALFAEISVNNAGHVDLNTELTLVLSEARMYYITDSNTYGVSVYENLLKTMPKLKLQVLHELSMPEGERMMLIANNVAGQSAGYLAFSEKGRVSPVIQALNHREQQFSGSVFGAIITNPKLIAQMTGI